MQPPLILREFGDAVVARLTEKEAASLQDCPAGIDVRLTREPGTYEVSASQFVGTVVLPTLTVRIIPKVSVERLVLLLGFTPESMKVLGATTAAVVPDVVTAMKTIYAAALETLLLRGLLRAYRTEEDNLTAVRGQIDILDLGLRRFGTFPPIKCRYQEYTVDREPNRRLFAAAHALARAGNRTDSASRTLFRLSGRFEGVELCRYTAYDLKPLVRDRLLTHYDPALGIAETVLQNASLELPSGSANAVAFVVDMNKVYERYVARALKSALGLDDRRWRTHPGGLYLDQGRKLEMEPDILWGEPSGRPRLVIDTKYKVKNQATPEDMHQVVAYCSALGLSDAVLLYADCPEDLHVIRKSGIRVHQWRLSLEGAEAELSNEVKRVAGALQTLYQAAESRAIWQPQSLPA